jgi:peroxiredoxin
MTTRIRALGAEPVAIAVTATFSQMAFSETLGVDFPMLSDWEGTVANEYGVQYDEWKGHSGLAKRSVFVIDGERRIRYRWVTDDALVEPDLEEALTSIKSLASSPQGISAEP